MCVCLCVCNVTEKLKCVWQTVSFTCECGKILIYIEFYQGVNSSRYCTFTNKFWAKLKQANFEDFYDFNFYQYLRITFFVLSSNIFRPVAACWCLWTREEEIITVIIAISFRFSWIRSFCPSVRLFSSFSAPSPALPIVSSRLKQWMANQITPPTARNY